MSKQQYAGVYQLNNGYWGYRYAIVINGKTKATKKIKDEFGNPFKTAKQAYKARAFAIAKVQALSQFPQQKSIERKTIQELFDEYCMHGRYEKAYSTIKKQNSLWNNHLKDRFGKKYLDEITVSEINDYLAELYYYDGRAYSYVESFLKMFYLIFGQAYSRGYLDVDRYNILCKNKDTKIHMPKLKTDEELDVIYFDEITLQRLDEYFSGTNAETAYMLGKYCGLRINECYGLKWDKIDLDNGIITIDRQMQYQDGLIKLVPLKTRNAKRKLYMCSTLKNYLINLKAEQQQAKKELAMQRQQNQTYITDLNGTPLSCLKLVNCLPNGKIQTVNSMKYHSRILQGEHNIYFNYRFLRHTYGTNMAVFNTPKHLLCNQMGHSGIHVTEKYYIAVSKNGISELITNLEKL